MVATPKLNSIANALNLSRQRHEYEDNAAVEFVQHKTPSFSQNKSGRASLGTISSPVNESDTPRTLRSFSRIFDKTMCIIPSADSGYKVIVFDGMAVANKIDIRKMNLKSFSDFASTFLQKLEKEAQGSEEVRVIFDRYIEESLKSGTRTGR